MLHPNLEPFRGVNYIKRINAVFKDVVAELDCAGVKNFSVDLQSDPDASVLRDLFTFRLSYDANQWLTVNSEAHEHRFRLVLPFRNGVTLPYSLEILLKSTALISAILHPSLTSRGRWYTEPLNYRRGKALRGLRLPGVGWTHASGGLKFGLQAGGAVLPPDENCSFNRWIIFSAYQGFLFVRPRIEKYLVAAARLENLLQQL